MIKMRKTSLANTHVYITCFSRVADIFIHDYVSRISISWY